MSQLAKKPLDRRGDGKKNQNMQGLSMITAPYNFVPLSRIVFFPEWAEKISHDVPFQDGISGKIECELTTESLIYVRNGGNWNHSDIMTKPEAQSFFKVGDKFIIPGTSLKGMLRNVIEIISFGKMDKVDDRKYSIRDLHNPQVYQMTDSINGAYVAKPKAAWLSQDKETREWFLTPCNYARVEQNLLIDFHPNKPDLKRKQSSVEKYEKWGDKLRVQFVRDRLREEPHPHSCGNLMYRKVEKLGSGSGTGTIVFTGQPSDNENKPRTKHMEFIFFDEGKDKFSVPDKLREEFKFIHSGQNGMPNKEWEDWEKKLREGEKVPVFYLGDIKNPTSMGLALMYRLAYNHSVCEAIKHSSGDHSSPGRPDLAEAIFGFVGEQGIKGRVYISPAVAVDAKPVATPITTILGAPKPTYYPNYIEQEKNTQGQVTQYKTFMDPDCRLRGWKRYPARHQVIPFPGQGQDEVSTRFVPLEKGAKFTFTINVHNLRLVELGALMWALTWGENAENAALCHSLGMGRPLGLGLVKIKIVSQELFDVKHSPSNDNGVKAFEGRMNREVPGWLESEQMIQILAMANPNSEPNGTTQDEKLRYMRLSPMNEFVDAKKQRYRLEAHAAYSGISDKERFEKRPKKCVAIQTTGGDPREETLDGVAERFDKIKGLNNKERFFQFFQSVKPGELDQLSKIDFKPCSSILNIGIADELDELEIAPEVKAVIARAIISFTSPRSKWDEKKLQRHEKLKSLADGGTKTIPL